jgi:hypothetical protein
MSSPTATTKDSRDEEKLVHNSAGTENIEAIRTISRVPGNPNYYEKNGLRTEGDGFDHAVYNSVTTLLPLLEL